VLGSVKTTSETMEHEVFATNSPPKIKLRVQELFMQALAASSWLIFWNQSE